MSRDWIVQTSSTVGIGAYTLGDPPLGTSYFPFRQRIDDGADDVRYWVVNAQRTKWEKTAGGTLTYGVSPGTDTLSRNVRESTNGDAPVAWTSDDLPLRVYIAPDSAVEEGIISGFLAATRPPQLRTGARWFDRAAGLAVSWIDKLVTGPATDIRVGLYDAVKDLYFPDSRRPSVAVGAANKTVLGNEIGVCFSYNTTAAPRTVTLPPGSTVKDGFTTSHVGLDIANGLIFTPDAGDGIGGGADGVTLTVPGKVPVSMRWDAALDTWASSYVPAQAPNWAGRRQTVAAGRVDSAGLPAFLPASSVSLNLTTDLNGVTLAVAAANGWLAANGRPNDLVGYTASNFTWSGLTASRAAATPNYLYVVVNADGSLTPGKTLLAPTYQWGGTPAVTDGQFTFNIAEMKGYLGNGATAPQTNLVMVGEAATDGSTVTSTVAYAYNGRYDSGYTDTLPAATTPVSKSHNIGVVADRSDFRIQCKTAQGGFAVGDEVGLSSLYDFDGANIGMPSLSVDRTAMSVVGAVTPWLVRNKSTAAQVTLTLANWKYRFIADRGWG